MRQQPLPISAVSITAHSLVCATGVGQAALAEAVRAQRSGLRPNDFGVTPLACWIGRVDGLAALDEPQTEPLPARLQEWDCRATRLAWLALQADNFGHAVARTVAQHGALRVGLVLGTSASTIGASEDAYRALDAAGRFPLPLRSERLNTPHALAAFVHEALQLQGPCVTVSTACSSSAKAFAQAERWLRLGWADAVVVGGVDALCNSVLFGFNALGLISPDPCQPFSAARSGISVGEAAGFALLQRGPGAVQLLGYGEANDAHHMSSPHPQGLGAEQALDDALARAGLVAEQIDFLSLHGTASALNDSVEAALVARRYAVHVHASASKGLSGHSMGAAGLLGASTCFLALQTGLCSGSVFAASGPCPNAQQPEATADPAFGSRFAQQWRARPVQTASSAQVQHAASHSFGFGGNNCVLIFGSGA